MKKINYMMLSCLFVLLGSCTEEVQQKANNLHRRAEAMPLHGRK